MGLPFGLDLEFGSNIKNWNLHLSRLVCLVMEFARNFIYLAPSFGVPIFLKFVKSLVICSLFGLLCESLYCFRWSLVRFSRLLVWFELCKSFDWLVWLDVS